MPESVKKILGAGQKWTGSATLVLVLRNAGTVTFWAAAKVPESTLATAKLGQLEEASPKRVALDTKHFQCLTTRYIG